MDSYLPEDFTTAAKPVSRESFVEMAVYEPVDKPGFADVVRDSLVTAVNSGTTMAAIVLAVGVAGIGMYALKNALPLLKR